MRKPTTTDKTKIIDVDTGIIDRVLDSLVVAKNAYALLPPLPKGVRPVHIRILWAISRHGGGPARISDINKTLGSALPNTTRFVNEMVQSDILTKEGLVSDRRVVLVRPTQLGQEYTEKYIHHFHTRMQRELGSLSLGDCEVAIRTINDIFNALDRLCHPSDSPLKATGGNSPTK